MRDYIDKISRYSPITKRTVSFKRKIPNNKKFTFKYQLKLRKLSQNEKYEVYPHNKLLLDTIDIIFILILAL